MLQAEIHKTITRKIVYHLKVAAGAVFISTIFSLVLFQRIFHAGLDNMLLLTFLQLELFLWLGHLFFRSIKPESPKFVQKTILRLALFYVSVLLIAFTLFLTLYLFYFIRSGAGFSEFVPGLMYPELKTFLLATLIGFAFGALFFFYTQWTDVVKSMQKLREEKLIFQYETLKSQVNPHFLFNSLNTLSSLVGKDPEQSEKFIQKLSSVYRYVLENQEKDLVPVSSELSFVRDYFALQQVRDQEKIELKIERNGPENALIMPVSLQMLVENALKHNVASRKEPLLITIHFEGLDKLTVRNNLQPRNQLKASSEIGLKNLNERCRLILGREIEIQKTMEEFVVKVPVKTELS
ncbi:histidine kinase [Maribellus sp. YY47]|uniref:sensor histidine kinase n=1 Tax=Maribellus sp. YY47 TaxID=2929486 RepID=UPI0020008006|nr:histidine kinase [Maribellus sp. YY47]MCK3683996.1 histidine kinase [Maribellus sp. YY47]